MRHSSVFVGVILPVLLLSCLVAGSQSVVPPAHDGRTIASDQKIVDLPLGSRQFKPKLSLQSALKIAEAYIDEEHINISSYWLYQADFILYGGKAKDDPCWHFLWINDGTVGGYIDIIVPMDGKAMRLPSM
jgi:hypothetical protein